MNLVFLDFTQSKFKDHLFIYTDDSRNASHVGSALWCSNKRFKEIFKLPPETFIYSAEGFAILRAVQYMKNVHDFNKFLVCTDLLGILKAINGFPINKNPSYIILYILEEINKLRVDGKEIKIL